MAPLAGFIGPSYVSQSPLADQEDLWNFYPERMESQGASTRWALYPTPGVEAVTLTTDGSAVSPTGIGKASFYDTSTGRLFVVIGAVFAEISAMYVFTSRGAVAEDSNPATICSNGDGGGQLFITSGGNGYLFDVGTNVFTTIAALAGKATQGEHLDGYFFSFDAGTSTTYISDLLDGTTWDPTQFVQRSIQADPWVAMKVAGRFIWFLGSQTSEAWFDAGTSPIPIQPHPSGVIQFGCAAPFSPEVVAGQLMWIAATVNGQGLVLRLSGFTAEPVSTFPLQVAFNGYSTITDAIGDSYDDLGHTFYILTFPTASKSWGWDAQTQLWHKRGTWISEDQAFEAWRPLFHAFAYGLHLMLDYAAGVVYRMSSALGYDADSRPIRRVRRSPGLVNELQRLYYGQFVLDLEPGLGLSTGQGSNPLVMMRTSDDGGKVWGTERLASSGRQGEYNTRVEWNRCGSAYRRVFEVSVSDPIPWRLLGAFVEIEQETA